MPQVGEGKRAGKNMQGLPEQVSYVLVVCTRCTRTSQVAGCLSCSPANLSLHQFSVIRFDQVPACTFCESPYPLYVVLQEVCAYSFKWFDHTPDVPKCSLPLLQKFHRSGRGGVEVSVSFFAETFNPVLCSSNATDNLQVIEKYVYYLVCENALQLLRIFWEILPARQLVHCFCLPLPL